MAFIGGVLDCASFGFLLTSGFGGSCAHILDACVILATVKNGCFICSICSLSLEALEAGMKLV